MKMSPLALNGFIVLGLALLVTADAQSGPVKVTIQTEQNDVGEGSSLPIDPTPKVRYGMQNDIMMPGLGGLNGERLTYSPQGGHEMYMMLDNQMIPMIGGAGQGNWKTRMAPLPKGPGGKVRHGVLSVWESANKKVTVTQIVEIIASKNPPKGKGSKRQLDVMLVRYFVENKDTVNHSVGIRNTIDIYLIDNDGALFASPTTHKDQIINGHEFKGDKMPEYVQVLRFPNLKDPGYVTHFTLKVGKLEPPTRFVCTTLGACFNGGWDIPPQQAGDSAVGILFDPKVIPPGGKRDMAYAYGIGIASSPENEGRVALNLQGGFEPGKQFTITAYVDEPLECQGLTLDLPAGLTRVEGKTTQAVPAPPDDGRSVVVWKVRVDKVGNYSIKVRSTNGVTYNTMLKIEASDKAELIRVEPKDTVTPPEPDMFKDADPNKKKPGKGDPAPGKGAIEEAKARLAEAEALLKKSLVEAQSIAVELKNAMDKGGVTKEKLKKLRAELEAGEAQCKRAAEVVEVCRARLALLDLEQKLNEDKRPKDRP
jgi:hypothetical protein